MSERVSAAEAHARCSAIFRALAERFGLTGWRFVVNPRLSSLFGRCQFSTRRVEVAEWLLASGDWPEIEDTLRHEVAHALCHELGEDDGHGPNWKSWARLCGARPERCGPHDTWEVHAPAARRPSRPVRVFEVACPSCATTIGHKRARALPTKWANARRTRCCGEVPALIERDDLDPRNPATWT